MNQYELLPINSVDTITNKRITHRHYLLVFLFGVVALSVLSFGHTLFSSDHEVVNEKNSQDKGSFISNNLSSSISHSIPVPTSTWEFASETADLPQDLLENPAIGSDFQIPSISEPSEPFQMLDDDESAEQTSLTPSTISNIESDSVSSASEPTPSLQNKLYDTKDRKYKYGSYKTNLSPDIKYFTYLPLGGTNNQLIALFHAFKLAHAINRTLVIPPIGPNLHIQTWNGPPYSEFYDLKRFTEETNIKVTEWHQIKPQAATVTPPKWIRDAWIRYAEPLNCFIRSKIAPFNGHEHRVTDRLRKQMFLNVKFLYYPGDVTYGLTKHIEEFVDAFSQAEENFLCVTDAYTLAGDEHEVWDTIGSHLHYTKKFEQLVDEYLGRLLPTSQVPFIGIHLRRGDIKTKCGFDRSTPIDEWRNSSCFVSIDALEESVAEIFSTYDIDPSTPVVIATNENDERELERINELGWILVDHDKFSTVERLGEFYPALLDAALLTRASWFIGSRKSAMSKFVADRAKSWYRSKVQLV